MRLRSAVPYHSLSLSSFAPSWPTDPTIPFSLFRSTLLATHLPLSLVFFWPAILTPKYPASGAALPLHLILFWPVILTPGYPVSSSSLPLHLFPFDRLFWRPAIRFLVSLSRSAASSFDRLFWHPTIRFPVPLSPAPPHPFLTGYFDARLSGSRSLSRSAASSPDRLFWRPAIRFPVPLSRSTASPSDRLFYRPDIRFSVPRDLLFTQPSLPDYLGGRLALCAALRLACGFYRPAVFTAPRFLPLRGFFFYRSAFTGSLGGFALPPPSCLLSPNLPPTSGRLALWATFRYACEFYRSAIFTAPRFLPLRGFYRSAVFTAPRFLPPRGFYRSAIFSAPLSPVLWGALLFLSALQSSPSSGRTLCYRLLRRVSGGTPFLIFFLDHLLNRSQSVTAHLTGFPFCSFHTH